MYVALAFMVAGILCGRLLRERVKPRLSGFIFAVVCLLLFVLGVELGQNEELVSKFATIGVSASLISISGVVGSCIAASIFYRYIVKGGKSDEK